MSSTDISNMDDTSTLDAPRQATWLDFVIVIGTVIFLAFLLVNLLSMIWNYIKLRKEIKKSYKRAKASRIRAEKRAIARAGKAEEDKKNGSTRELKSTEAFLALSVTDDPSSVFTSASAPAEETGKSARVLCPNCNDDILESRVNAHLDRCLARNSDTIV
ncbi:hypothetical protein SARC_06962 [Sphaeroforma arctica JP610]|uniref:SAGA-associated factor 11 n=1 Tax=Sphaeroforma arctica JP610 TaxID=667725 RepID=A0A0L0FVV6_9EUKA|nr:hypothetical protein SARC_06962 [Sphaeroforma arctica JP610]KNC80686.1 hypothetical protein SARC_06962 [Sphaeroforma arctica JP610]|eukprot:XP_014154588.1 hypothetical protein SARC_06962 [Sphaeroforma arctica JP610]